MKAVFDSHHSRDLMLFVWGGDPSVRQFWKVTESHIITIWVNLGRRNCLEFIHGCDIAKSQSVTVGLNVRSAAQVRL